jgi:hypothetical protein
LLAAEIGIGDAEAADVAAYMAKGNTFETEGIKLPDLEVMRADEPAMFRKVVGAFRRAAAEATPTPGMFDKPWYSRHPLGRLFFQFTTFNYTVGVRVLPKLMHDLRNDPVSFRLAAMSAGGLVTSISSLYLRAALTSPEALDKLVKESGTTEGRVQILQKALLLMPFLPGMSSQYVELIGSQLGAAVNTMIGTDMFLSGGARFQRLDENVNRKLLGPSGATLARVGEVATRLPRAGFRAATGETAGARQDLRRVHDIARQNVPFYNSVPLRLVTRAFNEVYGR